MHWLLGGYMWLFVHRPFEYYPALGEMQLERAYMLLMLVVWLVSPGKGLNANRMHVALSTFTVALTVCWLNSPWRDQCGEVVENQAKVVVFYVLLVTSVRDEAGLRRLLAMYLGAVGLYMAHSMLEFLNGRYEWRMGIVRMIGVDVTFRDPNSFASTLLLAMVMTLPFWARSRVPLARLGLLAFCGSASACVLLTGSRTGFVGLLVVGLFGMLVARANKAVVLALAAAACLGAVLLPGYLQDRFLTLIDPARGPNNAQESAAGRLRGVEESFELFERSPLVGIGPGAFGFATGKGFNPHNLYGQIVSEMGIAGILTFGVLVTAFVRNWREVRRLYQQHAWPRDWTWYAGHAVWLNVGLLLFLGLAGHNLYRYIWIWLAGFQVVAVHCVRSRAELDRRAKAAVKRLAFPRARTRRWMASNEAILDR